MSNTVPVWTHRLYDQHYGRKIMRDCFNPLPLAKGISTAWNLPISPRLRCYILKLRRRSELETGGFLKPLQFICSMWRIGERKIWCRFKFIDVVQRLFRMCGVPVNVLSTIWTGLQGYVSGYLLCDILQPISNSNSLVIILHFLQFVVSYSKKVYNPIPNSISSLLDTR